MNAQAHAAIAMLMGHSSVANKAETGRLRVIAARTAKPVSQAASPMNAFLSMSRS